MLAPPEPELPPAKPPCVDDCTIPVSDAVHAAAGLGARVVGLRNGEVIAEVGEIEVVFDSQGDGIVQRNVELSRRG